MGAQNNKQNDALTNWKKLTYPIKEKIPKRKHNLLPFLPVYPPKQEKKIKQKDTPLLTNTFTNIYPLHNSFEYRANHTATGSGSGDIRKDIKRDEASPLSLLWVRWFAYILSIISSPEIGRRCPRSAQCTK